MSSPVTPLTPEQSAQIVAKADSESYVHKVLVAFDQMSNVIGGGIPDETISARMARWATEDKGFREAVGLFVCRALNMVQKDHGALAELNDLGRAQAATKAEESAPTVQQEGQ